MTFSGGRRPRDRQGPSPAEFVARLAQDTSLSNRQIAQRAREIGIRIGNDRVNAIVKAARGLELTSRQSFVALTIDTSQLERLPVLIQRNLETALKRARDNAGIRIRYRVSAQTGFQWAGGGREPGTDLVTIDREVTIQFTQQQAFNRRLREFAATHARALLDQADVDRRAEGRSGQSFLESDPQIEILSTRPVRLDK